MLEFFVRIFVFLALSKIMLVQANALEEFVESLSDCEEASGNDTEPPS